MIGLAYATVIMFSDVVSVAVESRPEQAEISEEKAGATACTAVGPYKGPGSTMMICGRKTNDTKSTQKLPRDKRLYGPRW